MLVDGAAGWDLAGHGESWKPRARNAALSLSTIGTSYIFWGENTGNIQSSLEKWVAAGEGIKERSQYKGQGQWGSWRAASIIQPLDMKVRDQGRQTGVKMLFRTACGWWGKSRRCGFDPWVWKIPGGEHGKPLQYSCLENLMDRGAWRANSS